MWDMYVNMLLAWLHRRQTHTLNTTHGSLPTGKQSKNNKLKARTRIHTPEDMWRWRERARIAVEKRWYLRSIVGLTLCLVQLFVVVVSLFFHMKNYSTANSFRCSTAELLLVLLSFVRSSEGISRFKRFQV